MASREVEYLRNRKGQKVEFQDRELREMITEYQGEAADLRAKYNAILEKAAAAGTSADNAANSAQEAADTAQELADSMETVQHIYEQYESYQQQVSDQDQRITDAIAAQNQSITDQVTQQTTEKVAAQVAAMQVIEGQTVIDSTLTVSGAAAEAAKVGTEITELKNDITSTEMQMEMNYLLNVKGTLNSSTGANVSNNTYFRTDYYPVTSGMKCKYNLRTADTYAIIAVYNTSKEKVDTVVGTGALASGEYTFAQDGYVRFSCISGNPLKSASIQFEDGQVYKVIDDLNKKDAAVNQRIDDLTTISFNRFNKSTIITGKSLNHNNADIVTNANRSTTALIPVDPTIHGRIRASQKAAELAVFDSNKSPIAQGDYYTIQNRFAIDITGAAYVQMTFVDANTNYNTLMIAYTDETSGATADLWNSLFPSVGYVPYGEAIDSEHVLDKSINLRLSDILKNMNNTLDVLLNGNITADDVIAVLENTTGITVTTNQYTKEKQASITGTDTTKTWATISSKCRQGKVYLLEFYGYTNDDSWSVGLTTGAILKINFYDSTGTIIGSSYNGYVMGTQGLKYHRYGYVSPIGAKTMELSVITRKNSNMTISDVSVKEIESYPQKQPNGINFDGHIGMIYISPKNTMPSFELGKIAGYNTMITNINVTQDGVLVALHDNTIDATSDGTGNVSDFTYMQLLSYDFGSWFNAAYTGTKIPKFEEVVKFLSKSGISLGVSLHHNMTNAQLDDMCEIIQKYYKTPVLIKSFYLEDLQYVHDVLGEQARYMWVGTPTNSNINIVSALDYPVMFEISSSFTGDEDCEDFIEFALSQGVRLSCYYGDDIILQKRLIGLGVTNFTINTFPDNVYPMD